MLCWETSLNQEYVPLVGMWHRRTEPWFVWGKLQGGEKRVRGERTLSAEKRRVEERQSLKEGEFLWECLNTSSRSARLGAVITLSGDSAFQGLLLFLAAIVRTKNSLLFVFVQLNRGFFMTVYHGEETGEAPLDYWVSQINDAHGQSWVKHQLTEAFVS